MLEEALLQLSFAALLIFARVGSILMVLPGIGESFVPARIRLSFALLFAISLAPALSNAAPEAPATIGPLALMIGGEVLVGLLIGLVTRYFMMTLAVAGQVIGMQTGMAFAQSVDPTLGQQGAITGAFLNVTALALIFSTNLHHILLSGVKNSYDVFPAGGTPPVGDAAQWALETFVYTFALGVQIAAPLLVFGLVFYLALGVLSRLMPQVQIFFIALPSNILVGFAIFAMIIGSAMLVWLTRFEEFAMGLGAL